MVGWLTNSFCSRVALCSLAVFLAFPFLAPQAKADVPPEIAALAATLGDDPVKKFEYVRNNIRYAPYMYILKGPVRTLFDGTGNDFDQAHLLNALLQCTPGTTSEVVEGMALFRKQFKGEIWLEILFCKGINDAPAELQRMKEAVVQIEPDLIHLNTVVRPPSEKWVKPLGREEMEKIQAFFGGKASIISEFDRHLAPPSDREIQQGILKILRRRPLSLDDLSRGMGIPSDRVERQVHPLVEQGRVSVNRFGGKIYFEAVRDTEGEE